MDLNTYPYIPEPTLLVVSTSLLFNTISSKKLTINAEYVIILQSSGPNNAQIIVIAIY